MTVCASPGFPPLTCEVLQAELTQAKVSVPPVIEEDCQRVAVLIQLGPANDPQVLQRQVVKLVKGDQYVARHFADRLQKGRRREKVRGRSNENETEF